MNYRAALGMGSTSSAATADAELFLDSPSVSRRHA
jgi:hypothetical protein